ncbi:MAG: hypothetical protein JKX84_01785, partial [Flavobacteriales bacterium]|nr:hypothetical protein [Flavobacteriales bacterium]
METLRIDILNPKARKLLDGLADLKLIHISDQPPSKKKESSVSSAGKQRREALEKLAKMGGNSGKRLGNILQE